MRDMWLERDLPVLKAAIQVFERQGDPMYVGDIAAAAQLAPATVQRALRALSTEPFFGKGQETANGNIHWVGKPTGRALRVAGWWPSPEALLDRLVAALEAAGEEDERNPEERSRLRQVALALRTAAAQIAIGALGGAGGDLLSG